MDAKFDLKLLHDGDRTEARRCRDLMDSLHGTQQMIIFEGIQRSMVVPGYPNADRLMVFASYYNTIVDNTVVDDRKEREEEDEEDGGRKKKKKKKRGDKKMKKMKKMVKALLEEIAKEKKKGKKKKRSKHTSSSSSSSSSSDDSTTDGEEQPPTKKKKKRKGGALPTLALDKVGRFPLGRDNQRVQQRISSASEKMFPPYTNWRTIKKDVKLVQEYHLEVRGPWENGNSISDAYINATTASTLKDRHYRMKMEVESFYDQDQGTYRKPPGMSEEVFEKIKAQLEDPSRVDRSSSAGSGSKKVTNVWGYGGFPYFATTFVSILFCNSSLLTTSSPSPHHLFLSTFSPPPPHLACSAPSPYPLPTSSLSPLLIPYLLPMFPRPKMGFLTCTLKLPSGFPTVELRAIYEGFAS